MNDVVAEKHDFGAEVGRLLDLVVHSLYSEREIFLRELVANAADAMDRRRFESLTDPALAPPPEAKIRIVPDKAARTLHIADDGNDLPANEGTALWRKPRAEVSEQSYNEFYRHLGHLFDTPWATLHWRAEGMLEFFALLFIPGMKPFEPFEGDRDSHA